MNQKGFAKIILVIVVCVFVSIAGYFLIKGFLPQPKLPPPAVVLCPDIVASNEHSFSFSHSLVNIASAKSIVPPFVGKLCFLQKPLLNKTVTLEYRFLSKFDSPNVIAKIELPKNIQLVSGGLEWKGELKAGQQQNFAITIRPTKTGYYQIKGSLFATSVIDLEITPTDTHLHLGDVLSNWKTFIQKDNLYIARYPEPWQVQSASTELIKSDSFGYTTEGSFKPIIKISFGKNYVPATISTNEKDNMVFFERDIKGSSWPSGIYGVKQTINENGSEIIRIKSTENYKDYIIQIDLLQPQYLPILENFLFSFGVIR